MERVSAIARHVVPSETSQLQGAPQRPHELIVDAWAQHPTARFLDEPFLESLRRWTRSLSSGATGLSQSLETSDPPLELTVDSMDAGGVRHTLLNAWAPPKRAPLISNDEVAACVARYPQRFSGIGSVDFSRPMDAIREIRRCAHDLKFVGIRILPWLCEVPPTDKRFYPIYATCCELGLPLCTQIGHTGPLMPSEVGRPIYLDEIALHFPDLTIVGGHIGAPWTKEAIAVATKHQNVYIDTSAYSVRRYPNSLVKYMRTNGRSKVLFGTNFPMMTPAHALVGLDDLGLDAEARRLFLADNARRVFKLELDP